MLAGAAATGGGAGEGTATAGGVVAQADAVSRREMQTARRQRQNSRCKMQKAEYQWPRRRLPAPGMLSIVHPAIYVSTFEFCILNFES
jgi:hypothetical protein